MPGYREEIYDAIQQLFGRMPDFDPDHDMADFAWVKRWAPITKVLSKYFRPTYHGLEHIPRQGPALMVGNHGLMVIDGFFLGAAIYQARGRLLRGLAEEVLFIVPGSREFCCKVGAVHGTPENALRYLQAGHLMNTYPGGAKDALKKRSQLYKLHWGNSFGFVKVALRAQVPVILHMGVGTDDPYRIVGRLKWTGRVMGSSKYEVPILMGWGPIPRPVKFTYYISEPIQLEGEPEDADKPEVVQRIHADLWRRGQAMLDDGLRRRRSLWFG